MEQLFADLTKDITYIVPRRENWNPENPVCATELRIGYSDKWDQEIYDKHFMAVDLGKPGMEQFPLTASILRKQFSQCQAQLKNESNFFKDLDLQVAHCITQINYFKRYMDDDGKTNEATVRIIGGNHIAVMLCAIHDLVFRVEDKIVVQVVDKMQSLQLSEAVTARSVTDYICYTTFHGMQLTTILLETKAEYHRNALARLLGYYIRACSNVWKPGVCVLLTKDVMQLVLFPFVDKQSRPKPLVNAIALKPFHYLDDLELSLKLLALVTHQKFNPQIVLDKYVARLRCRSMPVAVCEVMNFFEFFLTCVHVDGLFQVELILDLCKQLVKIQHIVGGA